MNEKRVEVELTWYASWTAAQLGLPPDATKEEMENALDDAITGFLNSGITAIDPPDEISEEYFGFE